MNKKPTIQDIAREAGVGPGTVSRVLNGHPNVSDRTRAKVASVIETMKYRPSFAARHMRTQKSRLIGFISDEVATTPFAGKIILGAQDVAWEQEYILLVANIGDDVVRIDKVVETFLERDVEGIIFSSMYHREVYLPEKIVSVPVVLANCYSADAIAPAVVPDEYKGGYEATANLIGAGHRRIGFINVNTLEPGIPASIGRWRGYRAALAAAGIAAEAALEHPGYGSEIDGYNCTHALMALDERPTAIFCANDRTAWGAYNALAEIGLRIPDDVAIIGFDNQTIIAESLHPALTTMELPHYEMGRWAANYLICQPPEQNRFDEQVRRLTCPLIPRDSV